MRALETPAPGADQFLHDQGLIFLNHGSFGSCPRPILEAQEEWRRRLEGNPIRFMVRELEPALDQVRRELGEFLGASGDDLALVVNATEAVNTVLHNQTFEPGDELLTTDHAYNACKNVLDRVAAKFGAAVVVASVPFPVESPERVHEEILSRVSSRTKFALLDHVTSPTGLVLPVETLVPALQQKGVKVLIDGAHGPGMLNLRLDQLGAEFYTGNCHKWLCTPKGSAVLHVRRDQQQDFRPLSISHGANSPRTDRSLFRLEFDWTGTSDPTAWLAIPRAIEWLGACYEGGWDELRKRNHELVGAARTLVCEFLQVKEPCPLSMLGSLAAIPFPDGNPEGLDPDPQAEILAREFQIEVPIRKWPVPPKRLLRLSAQLYNTMDDYRRLIAALGELKIA